MKKEQVSQILEEMAEEAVPASLDLWPGLQPRLARQAPALSWVKCQARLRWASLTLAVLVALAALAFGATRAVEWFRHVGASRQVVDSPPAGQSQTVGGVTVLLPRAALEADSLVVGLVISATDPQRYAPYQITLTNAAGVILPRLVGQGFTATCVISDADPGPGNGHYTFTFAIRREISAAAQLHLTIQLRDRLDAPPPPGSTVGPFVFTITVNATAPGVAERIDEPANRRSSEAAIQRPVWSSPSVLNLTFYGDAEHRNAEHRDAEHRDASHRLRFTQPGIALFTFAYTAFLGYNAPVSETAISLEAIKGCFWNFASVTLLLSKSSTCSFPPA